LGWAEYFSKEDILNPSSKRLTETKDKIMETITELEQKVVVRKAIAEYIEFMDAASAKHIAENFPSLQADRFWVESGKKYIKIAQGPSVDGQGASVHCFVDALTGDVYKSAGWKAPALNGARYNLLDADSLALLKKRFDVYGGYLYKK
jgi:hypothetical protein